MVKVSARAADLLVERGMNVERLVSEAASRLGGEGGGHKGAAGATIPKGSQETFISCIEEALMQNRTGGLNQLDKAACPESNINISVPQHVLSCNMERRRLKTEGVYLPEGVIGHLPTIDAFQPQTPSIEDSHGRAETKRGEDCRRKASGDAFRPERAAARIQITSPAAEGSRFQKMEGQGLVRYFGPKDVQ
jgi:hypothetical protein